MQFIVTAWSYSRLADYEQCPAKFRYKYLEKMPEPGSPAMERGNVIHKQAENFIKSRDRSAEVPKDLKYVAEELKYLRDVGAMAEEEWGFQNDFAWTRRKGWFGDDVWFRAKADVVVEYDDNTLLLGDWKTGKKYDVNEDQVELFALAGFHRFPKVKEVDTRLWYTDLSGDNEVRRIYYEDEVDRMIKKWNKKTTAMFADRKFPPKPNDRCKWCHYRKSNGGPCRI